MLAVQRSAGNAATTALLARTAAPLRLIQREPDEKDVRERAHELWVKKGSPIQTREDEDADYFDALRQLRIEERAHANWEAKGSPQNQPEEVRTKEYYAAEKQLAEEAAAAQPSVEQAAKEVEIPKEPAAVDVPEATVPPGKEQEEELAVTAAPAKPAAPALYVPAHKKGVSYGPVAPAPAAAPLPPGSLPESRLRAVPGCTKKQGRWQVDCKDWYGFHVHISVNPSGNAFDEFHVKLDLGTEHRVYYFFDVDGNVNWDKSTKQGAAKAALKADGVRIAALDAALKEMDRVAFDEARWFASKI